MLTGPHTARPSSSSSSSSSVPAPGLQTGHDALISVGVILLVVIVLIEVAGTSSTAAMGVGAILVAALLLRGMASSGSFAAFATKYPWLP